MPSPATPLGVSLALPSVALAFVAGFADAASFVGADGIFCAHVTGNFVVLAADLARRVDADEWLKLATFPIFVASVVATTLLHRRASVAVERLLGLQGLAFGAAAAVGAVLPSHASGVVRSAIVALLVFGMGIQNALHRLAPSLGPMTTVMTGNVTAWFMEAVMPSPPEAGAKHRTLGATIAAFAAGCAAGALGVARFGFVVMAVPMALAWFVATRFRAPASKPAG